MRGFLNIIKFIFIALLVIKTQAVYADVAPISFSDANNILNPPQKVEYQEKEEIAYTYHYTIDTSATRWCLLLLCCS